MAQADTVNRHERQRTWPLVTLVCVLMFFTVMYAALILLGYVLVPMNRTAPALLSTVITAVMILLTVLIVKDRKRPAGKTSFLTMALPLVAGVFVLGKAFGYDTDGIELYLLPAYAIITLICSMIVFFSLTRNKKARIWLGAVYSIMFLPLALWLALWDFGPQPVMRTEASADGSYVAEVVASDRGIFGRNTLVYVTRQGEDKELPIGLLRRAPQLLFKDAYGVHEGISLLWESDAVLLINKDRYPLPERGGG